MNVGAEIQKVRDAARRNVNAHEVVRQLVLALADLFTHQDVEPAKLAAGLREAAGGIALDTVEGTGMQPHQPTNG